MTKIRQFPEITVQAPTDAFLIDREGEGTFYIEAQNIVTPPGTLVITEQDGVTVVAATVALNFTGGATVTKSGSTANVAIPVQNAGTVTSVDISGGTSGLTASGGPITSSGSLTLGGILNVANGGTGTTSPALTAGSNITLTGSWPNYTIAATGITSGTVTSVDVSGGSTGLSFTGGPITSSGTITASGVLAKANGGTGQTNPSLIGGTNVSISGTWPNQTINASPGTAALTIGTSTITSGTSGRILYDNAGVLGELATTGSGNVVRATSPALVTPNLGTPSAATLTNATGLPLTTGTTGILTVAKGGTGTSSPSLVAGTNVTISGTWPNQTINSSASAGGLTIGSSTIASGTSGYILYNNAGVLGNLSTIPVANGGTGTSSPGLVAGTNVTISGSWPNQTINASGGGGGGSVTVQQAGSNVVTSLATLNFVQGATVGASGTTANVTIPTEIFGSGAPGSGGPLVLDGTATGTFSGTTSGTATITTTLGNDVIVAIIASEGGSPTVSSVTASGLTFTRRGGSSYSSQNVEIWWAPAASIQAAKVVTVTLTSAPDDAAIILFAVNGPPNINAPWDANGTLPAFTNGGPAAAPTFSTSNANDFIFAGGANTGYSNDTSAWTTLATADNGGGALAMYLASFYEIVSSTQSGATASLTSSSSGIKIRFVDALATSLISSPVDGDLYFDQSTTPYTQYVYKGGAWHQAGLVGYATGSGGTVTQATSRTTGVTINTPSGAITMFSAAGSATAATFTVTNSSVAATDTISLSQKSGTNLYNFIPTAVSAGSFNVTFYTTGGTATDAPVINFNVIKGVTS